MQVNAKLEEKDKALQNVSKLFYLKTKKIFLNSENIKKGKTARNDQYLARNINRKKIFDGLTRSKLAAKYRLRF